MGQHLTEGSHIIQIHSCWQTLPLPGGGNFFFSKDKQYQHLTHAEKIFKYTQNLNLPILKTDFFLNDPKFTINKNEKKFNIFINLDSHHDQNNWDLKNYIKIISKIIKYNINIFINFSPNKKHFFKLIPEDMINSKNIFFTCQKSILEIMEIIYSCDIVIGNESGPICLAASFKKEVHSIYLPIHTKPESQIINEKTFYYNTDENNSEFIVNKIINNLLRKIS